MINLIKNEKMQNIAYKVTSFLPDELFIKLKFKRHMGYWPNLKNPVTYNEKLQWMKLNYHNPEEAILVDKHYVRKYVSNVVGSQILIPEIGVWKRAEDIDFNTLPSQFVLKCTHDSGSVIICKDKSKLDIEATKKWLTKRLNASGGEYGREWNYSQVEPQIIAEKYMEEIDDQVKDYKFFCFDGEPVLMFVGSDRFTGIKFDFFDLEFNHLDIVNGHPQNKKNIPEKPANFDKMLDIVRKLSKGLPHVRVDLYNLNGAIYFGELTFNHFSGFTPFEPSNWDYYLGEKFILPNCMK